VGLSTQVDCLQWTEWCVKSVISATSMLLYHETITLNARPSVCIITALAHSEQQIAQRQCAGRYGLVIWLWSEK